MVIPNGIHLWLVNDAFYSFFAQSEVIKLALPQATQVSIFLLENQCCCTSVMKGNRNEEGRVCTVVLHVIRKSPGTL